MKPQIVIDNEVYEKIMHWVNKSRNEVSGLGTIVIEKDSTIRVISAMLLPQTNHATHTEITAEGVNKAMFALKDSPGELKFWWHSHVMMPVFWSGTDHATIKEFGAHDYILATVFNQKKEMRSAYYDPKGVRTPWGNSELFLDECSTRIERPAIYSLTDWDSEYDKNVAKHVPIHPIQPKGYDSYGQWGWGEQYPRDKKGKFRQTTPEERHEFAKKKMTKADNKSTILTPDYDDYGFDSAERAFFAEVGLSLDDLDYLFTANFCPTEILDLFQNDATMAEIREHLIAGSSPEEIVAMLCADDGQLDLVDLIEAHKRKEIQ